MDEAMKRLSNQPTNQNQPPSNPDPTPPSASATAKKPRKRRKVDPTASTGAAAPLDRFPNFPSISSHTHTLHPAGSSSVTPLDGMNHLAAVATSLAAADSRQSRATAASSSTSSSPPTQSHPPLPNLSEVPISNLSWGDLVNLKDLLREGVEESRKGFERMREILERGERVLEGLEGVIARKASGPDVGPGGKDEVMGSVDGQAEGDVLKDGGGEEEVQDGVGKGSEKGRRNGAGSSAQGAGATGQAKGTDHASSEHRNEGQAGDDGIPPIQKRQTERDLEEYLRGLPVLEAVPVPSLVARRQAKQAGGSQ